MTKVLVTGASGFVAKHILRELLTQNYLVRASVRSSKRKQEIESLFPDANIEFCTLDLLKDKGWDEALNGVDVLIHTASPFPLEEPKNPDDLIRPAVDGTLRALNAAKTANVNRVILTSSCAAIYKDSTKEKGAPSTEKNWTDTNLSAVTSYEKSKTLAEKAAWEFVEQHPQIKLTTINPGMIVGAPMDKHFGVSLGLIERLLAGKDPMAPPMTVPLVSVADVAQMHVGAIGNAASEGERYAAISGAMSFADMGKMLKARYPQKRIATKEMPVWLVRIVSVFMPELKGVVAGLGYNLEVSGQKAEQTFGFEFVPCKDALLETAEYIENHN